MYMGLFGSHLLKQSDFQTKWLEVTKNIPVLLASKEELKGGVIWACPLFITPSLSF